MQTLTKETNYRGFHTYKCATFCNCVNARGLGVALRISPATPSSSLASQTYLLVAPNLSMYYV